MSRTFARLREAVTALRNMLGHTSPLRTITRGINDPVDLTIDRSGDLYVANHGPFNGPSTVTVYAPEKRRCFGQSPGVKKALRVALDSSGNLYVANCFNCPYGGTVTVYAPGSKNVLHTISQAVTQPRALAFDGSNYLYIADYARRKKRVAPGNGICTGQHFGTGDYIRWRAQPRRVGV